MKSSCCLHCGEYSSLCANSTTNLWRATDTGIPACSFHLIKRCMLREWQPIGHSEPQVVLTGSSKNISLFACFIFRKPITNTLTEKSRIIPVRRLIPIPVILPSRAKFQSWMWAVRGLTLCLLVPVAGTVSSLRSNPNLPAFILQSCGVRCTHTPKWSSPPVISEGLLQKHAPVEPRKIYERRDHTTSQYMGF